MPLISNLPLNWALIIILQFKQEYSLSVNSLKTHPETASFNRNKTTYKLQMQGVAGKVPLGQTFEFMSCCQNTIL